MHTDIERANKPSHIFANYNGGDGTPQGPTLYDIAKTFAGVLSDAVRSL